MIPQSLTPHFPVSNIDREKNPQPRLDDYNLYLCGGPAKIPLETDVLQDNVGPPLSLLLILLLPDFRKLNREMELSP